MRVVNYTKARNNLRQLINEVVDGNEEVIITTRDEKSVLMVPLDRYSLSREQILEDIAVSLEEAERGEVMSIDEAFEKAKRAYREHQKP